VGGGVMEGQIMFNFRDLFKKNPIPKFSGLRLEKRFDSRDIHDIETGVPKLSIQELLNKYGPKYRVGEREHLIKGDYQNGQGECVLQSWTYGWRVKNWLKTKQDIDLSEAFSYAYAEEFEEGPPDPGTYLWCGGKVFQKIGVCKASIYQPDRSIPFLDYIALEKIPSEALEDAKNQKFESYVRIGQAGWGNINAGDLMNAIVNWDAVIIAQRNIKKTWLRDDGYIIPAPSGSNYFYHATAVDDWEMKNGKLTFRFANWWDSNRSAQLTNALGRGYFGEEYLGEIFGAFSGTEIPRENFPKTYMYKRRIDSKQIQYIIKENTIYEIPDLPTLQLLLDLGVVTQDEPTPIDDLEKARYTPRKLPSVLICDIINKHTADFKDYLNL